MQFTKQQINKLVPTEKIKRTTVKGLSLMIEQKPELMTFYFKYKSPASGKTRFKKLTSHYYKSLSARDLKNIKDAVTMLESKVIAGEDPLDEQNYFRSSNLFLPLKSLPFKYFNSG